mgnify:CR=1 FL=1
MASASKWLHDTEELFTNRATVEVAQIKFIWSSMKTISLNPEIKEGEFSAGSYIVFRVSSTEINRQTVSAFGPQKNIIELLVYMHHEAPGYFFINNLRGGDTIKLFTPNELRKYHTDTNGKYMIFGDETFLGIERLEVD